MAEHLGWMWANVTKGWKVPRVADANGVVSPEEEARCLEQERALDAGEVRPSYWTAEMEAELGKANQ